MHLGLLNKNNLTVYYAIPFLFWNHARILHADFAIIFPRLLLPLVYDWLCAEKLLVELDPAVYYFISQGCLTVDTINDFEEMHAVDVCHLALHHMPAVRVCVCVIDFSSDWN
jgi:hypothetical protein